MQNMNVVEPKNIAVSMGDIYNNAYNLIISHLQAKKRLNSGKQDVHDTDRIL